MTVHRKPAYFAASLFPPAAPIFPRFWRRQPYFVAASLVLLLAVIWAHFRTATPSDFERFHSRLVPCVRVIDSDTIDLDVPDGRSKSTRVCLRGVHPFKDGQVIAAGNEHGEAAADVVRTLVEHKCVRVVLSPEQTRDSQGRLLAYVYLPSGSDESMLNEELIARGLAYADRHCDHLWRLRFDQIEERAQKQRRGMWERIGTDPMPAGSKTAIPARDGQSDGRN